MKLRRFTPDEDQAIIAGYHTRLLAEIAGQIGRPAKAVVARAALLAGKGVVDASRRYHHRHWTNEEDDWLFDHWGLFPDAQIARHLRRSVVACVIRAKRAVGVSRRMAFWTARDVAWLFGVDVHVITDRWIRAGAIRAQKSYVRCGDGHIVWRIDDEAIQAFIRNYPWHYDRKRIERDTVYRQLAERVYARDPWFTVDEAAAELGVCPGTVRRHLRRGWLQGVKTWEAGLHGGWRVVKSELARFGRKKEPVTVSPALQAWYNRRSGQALEGSKTAQEGQERAC